MLGGRPLIESGLYWHGYGNQDFNLKVESYLSILMGNTPASIALSSKILTGSDITKSWIWKCPKIGI